MVRETTEHVGKRRPHNNKKKKKLEIERIYSESMISNPQ